MATFFHHQQQRPQTTNPHQQSYLQLSKEQKKQKSNQNYQKQIESYVYNSNDQIGVGQFSKVYSGHHISTREKVAIKVVEVKKVIQPIFMNLLQNEIAILKILDHKNLLLLKGVYSTTNNIYIVTEFCNQGDLNDIIMKKKIVPEYRAIKILKHLVNGLIKLQQHEIIHRDIKPANILVSEGIPKLADFGFAISKQLSINQKTSFEGFTVGTPLYMAPETLLSNQYTFKTDIWALGCVFYEMLFGMVPFMSLQHHELIQKIKQYSRESKLSFPQIHQAVSKQSLSLLQSLLQYDPAKRMNLSQILLTPIFNEACIISHQIQKQLQSSNQSQNDNQHQSKVLSHLKTQDKHNLVKKVIKKQIISFHNLKGFTPTDLTNNQSGEKSADPQTKLKTFFKVGPQKTFNFIVKDINDQLRENNLSDHITPISEYQNQSSPNLKRQESDTNPNNNSYGRITRKGIRIHPKTLLFDSNAQYFCQYIDSVMVILIKDQFFVQLETSILNKGNDQSQEVLQIRQLKDKLKYFALKFQIIFQNEFGVVQLALEKYKEQLNLQMFQGDVLTDKVFALICNRDYSLQLVFFTTYTYYIKICILCLNKYLNKHFSENENQLSQNIQQSIILLDYLIITYQFLQLFIKDFNDFGSFCKKSQIERFLVLNPEINISVKHWAEIKNKIQILKLE